MTTAAPRSQSSDFPASYGEVAAARDSPARGAMVIKPYGYAIREAIQREMGQRRPLGAAAAPPAADE
jgi:hypothetical protein